MIDKFLKQFKADQITYRMENYGFNSDNTTSLGKAKSKYSTCYSLYPGMTVRPDGNVYPCAGKGFDRLPYGNILKQDLSEIWNNKYYRFSRSLFRKGAALEYNEDMKDVPCITCPNFLKKRDIRSFNRE